ncbi:MAG: hypothetical protein HY260_01110 [Chloroflexi bacterium]|nr:hypothetical protein [Chloroflexota bacterium]
MLDELRARMIAHLSQHCAGVLSAAGAPGAWAMPVRYRSRGLEVDCLLPRWADAGYHLQQNPHAVLVIQETNGSTGQRWLQYRGIAQPVTSPDWKEWLTGETPTALADGLYLVVHLTPERIDLIDESRGWGARETLEIVKDEGGRRKDEGNEAIS